MNSSRRRWLFGVAPALAGALALRAAATQNLERVDAKYVCFVNKHKFDKEQIPVKVEGRTYYGCCDMCKAKLTEDANSRFDTDPVSGKRVDKATAVIGADADGKVYFFQNENNLRSYHPPAGK